MSLFATRLEAPAAYLARLSVEDFTAQMVCTACDVQLGSSPVVIDLGVWRVLQDLLVLWACVTNARLAANPTRTCLVASGASRPTLEQTVSVINAQMGRNQMLIGQRVFVAKQILPARKVNATSARIAQNPLLIVRTANVVPRLRPVWVDTVHAV